MSNVTIGTRITSCLNRALLLLLILLLTTVLISSCLARWVRHHLGGRSGRKAMQPNTHAIPERAISRMPDGDSLLCAVDPLRPLSYLGLKQSERN